MSLTNERQLYRAWQAEDRLQADIRIHTRGRLGVDVQARVLGGLVILTGHTSVALQRNRCEAIAQRHSCGSRVANFITLPDQKFLMDWEIAEMIRDSFRKYSMVDARTVAVVVNAGVVTLKGAVAPPATRNAFAEIARLAPRVRNVASLLSGSADLCKHHESQYRVIRQALSDTHGLDGSDLELSVGGDTGTLSGHVRESWQRDMAGAIVLRFPVNCVVNDLLVKAQVAEPDRERVTPATPRSPRIGVNYANRRRFQSTACRC